MGGGSYPPPPPLAFCSGLKLYTTRRPQPRYWIRWYQIIIWVDGVGWEIIQGFDKHRKDLIIGRRGGSWGGALRVSRVDLKGKLYAKRELINTIIHL